MKLFFMKQSALDYMKANMGSLYMKYYQFDSPEWIDELFDYDPFELFAVVPDFQLADHNQQPGEIDLQNCKILYEHLKNLTESQAADERLWAGLCNKTFYSYVRTRWQYARKHIKKSADDSSAVLSRFYYRSSGRSGLFRNTLARCWWTGRLTYSDHYANKWELLDAIGAEDIISKISDIFYNNTYSSNSTILEGLCLGLKFFRDRGIHVGTREHIRPTVQYLNAIGGAVLLDMFTAEEIKNLVIERLALLIKGEDSGFLVDEGDAPEEVLDVEIDEVEDDLEEVNLDYADFLDSLEPITELNLDRVLGKLDSVEYGCKIHIRKTPENTYFISSMPMAGGNLNMLQRWFLGKKIGAKQRIGASEYEIVDISR